MNLRHALRSWHTGILFFLMNHQSDQLCRNLTSRTPSCQSRFYPNQCFGLGPNSFIRWNCTMQPLIKSEPTHCCAPSRIQCLPNIDNCVEHSRNWFKKFTCMFKEESTMISYLTLIAFLAYLFCYKFTARKQWNTKGKYEQTALSFFILTLLYFVVSVLFIIFFKCTSVQNLPF